MTGLIIRSAEMTDLAELLDLYAGLAVESEERLSRDEGQLVFQRIRRCPGYVIYIAELGGDIIGAFSLMIMDNLAHRAAPAGIVEDLVIAPEHRGCGVGTALMHHAMERCRLSRCYKMSLSSNLVRVEAHQFYEKLGFIRHGYSFAVPLDQPL